MRKMRVATLALALFAGVITTAFADEALKCTAPPPEPAAIVQPITGQPNGGMQAMYHQVWQYINDTYYDQTKLADWPAQEHAYDAELVDLDHLHVALKKMTSSLGDKWTTYISPADVMAEAQRRNDGLTPSGLEIYKRHGNRYQIDVLRWGTAAYHSALRERDIVACLNGVEIGTLSQDRVNAMVRGKVGDTLVVTTDDGSGTLANTTLTITAVQPEEITARVIDGHIAYLRLPTFEHETPAAEFVEKFVALQKENPGIDGLVLDLRNNLGGDITTAVKFSSLFLPEGKVVVRSIKRDGASIKTTDLQVVPAASLMFNRTPVEPQVIAVLRKLPMVLLINGSSASASEITTGAIKDNHRATVLGITTFGKGVGFRTMPGPIGGLVSVTGLKYLTPSGYDVHGRGIDPIVSVEQPRSGAADTQLDRAIVTVDELLKK